MLRYLSEDSTSQLTRCTCRCYLRCRSNSLQSLFSSYNDVYVWPRSAMYKVREDARLREQDFGNYQDLLHVSCL